MRRKDRAMDKEFGLKVIDSARYGVVSMIDEEEKPYGLPLSIVRDENILYFHSAMDGKKVGIFKSSPDVCITFVGETHIPENYTKDELEAMNNDSSKAVKFISSVFTTEYESAIVRGNVKLVEADEEKIKAMKLICEKYAPTKMEYFNTAIKAGLGRTNVYSVEIEAITAKRKKYDLEGKEMKWARME